MYFTIWILGQLCLDMALYSCILIWNFRKSCPSQAQCRGSAFTTLILNQLSIIWIFKHCLLGNVFTPLYIYIYIYISIWVCKHVFVIWSLGQVFLNMAWGLGPCRPRYGFSDMYFLAGFLDKKIKIWLWA